MFNQCYQEYAKLHNSTSKVIKTVFYNRVILRITLLKTRKIYIQCPFSESFPLHLVMDTPWINKL